MQNSWNVFTVYLSFTKVLLKQNKLFYDIINVKRTNINYGCHRWWLPIPNLIRPRDILTDMLFTVIEVTIVMNNEYQTRVKQKSVCHGICHCRVLCV